MRQAPLLAVSLLALVAAACERDAEPPGVRVFDRLIAVEPAGTFEDDVAGPMIPLTEWNLRHVRDQQRWTILRGDDWDGQEGLPLRASLVRLRSNAAIDTAGVETLRIDLGVPRRCRVAVYWQGLGDPLVVAAPPTPSATLRVELSSQPQWAARVEAMVVTLRNCRGGDLVGMALEGRSEHVVEAFTEAWKVTLGDDTRRALLAAPGTERSWTLREELRSGSLRIALGVTDALDAPLRFTIGSRERRGDETILTEVTLAPEDQTGSPRWHDVRVPLAEMAAGSEIYLRTDSDAPWRPVDGVPAFAEPRILTGGDDPRPNVLLLSIDTLRADHLSLYGYERETSPNLDRRARSAGVTFSNVVASAGWTLPSHVSMLSGVDALRHGVNHERTPIPSTMRFATESLRDAGFATIAFTAGGFVSHEFGFSRGFESFRARRPQKRSVEVSRAELGHGIDQLTAWLAEPHDQPFFAFFHTYEVHTPFWARAPHFERFGGRPEDVPLRYAFMNEDRRLGERSFVIPGADGEPLLDADPEVIEQLYDSGIAYMDSEIERLFNALEASGLAENTIVILTSDHGESLGEHDLVGHGQAYDEVAMIPLVLWVPGVENPRRVDAQVRLVDVAATILDLVGLGAPAQELDGQSLRPLWEDTDGYESRPAWIHAGRFGVGMRIANRMKYVWHRVPWDYFGPGEELFDLRNDPSESRDLSQADPALLASARQQTHDWLLDNLPGPRLTVENGSSLAYELLLRSEQSRPPGVTNFGCRDLAWRRRDEVILRLDAGESCMLVLEHLRAGDLVVEARARRTRERLAPASLTLSAAELADSARRVLVDGSWEPWSAPGGDGLSVRVEWAREPTVEEEAEVEIDEALAEQLRALGYLD